MTTNLFDSYSSLAHNAVASLTTGSNIDNMPNLN